MDLLNNFWQLFLLSAPWPNVRFIDCWFIKCVFTGQFSQSSLRGKRGFGQPLRLLLLVRLCHCVRVVLFQQQ